MGDYSVIGDVSEIIESALNRALVDLQPAGAVAELNDLSETIPPDRPRLTVFLYEIAEDPSSRNRPPVRSDPSQGAPTVRKPPMALILRYLITAWGGDPVTQHRMLGKALETFYDNAILSGSQLSGSLAATTDALHFMLTPLTLDQKAWVWYAIQKPYRLSLNYEVRVVNLDSATTTPVVPVTSRTIVPAGFERVPR
ncbi:MULTISPECIES: DUF4255 domain-containing protein [Actinoplanes]|uniref:DUF4255 domain-containing protein n=1 Tax=Actinoplanes TaxID=1865 RepID=UPI0005F2D43E|nr:MULTISPECIES: DUF4255 domain-containing protein [Actinoplanes]GLY05324.1 hypothetical protein Acsp01_57030 [Actinoplanes sp. NBRC 101535]